MDSWNIFNNFNVPHSRISIAPQILYSQLKILSYVICWIINWSMLKRITYMILILSLLPNSYERSHKQKGIAESSGLKDRQVHGYLLPHEATAKRTVILAGKSTVVQTCRPRVTFINTNVGIAIATSHTVGSILYLQLAPSRNRVTDQNSYCLWLKQLL